jgi:hypothetical protein
MLKNLNIFPLTYLLPGIKNKYEYYKIHTSCTEMKGEKFICVIMRPTLIIRFADVGFFVLLDRKSVV